MARETMCDDDASEKSVSDKLAEGESVTNLTADEMTRLVEEMDAGDDE